MTNSLEKIFGTNLKIRLVEFFLMSPNVFFTTREMCSVLKAKRAMIELYLRELIDLDFLVLEKRKTPTQKHLYNFYSLNDNDEIASLLLKVYHRGNMQYKDTRVRYENKRMNFVKKKLVRNQIKNPKPMYFTQSQTRARGGHFIER